MPKPGSDGSAGGESSWVVRSRWRSHGRAGGRRSDSSWLKRLLSWLGRFAAMLPHPGWGGIECRLLQASRLLFPGRKRKETEMAQELTAKQRAALNRLKTVR